MSKKRRTRDEKVFAELKRQEGVGQFQEKKFTYSFGNGVANPSIINTNVDRITSKNYSYIKTEIKHTIFITSLILILNLGFFFLEKKLNTGIPGF